MWQRFSRGLAGSGLLWHKITPAAACCATAATSCLRAHMRQVDPFPVDEELSSVLAIGYRAQDSFRWHTDRAGDDGWVVRHLECFFSFALY